jgi:hypothetical protein
MNMKALGIGALVGLLAVGLIAGTAVAASTSSVSAPAGTQTNAQNGHCNGIMNLGDSAMNGLEPHGSTVQSRAMNGTPGYPECPYYPSGNSTGNCGNGPKNSH